MVLTACESETTVLGIFVHEGTVEVRMVSGIILIMRVMGQDRMRREENQRHT